MRNVARLPVRMMIVGMTMTAICGCGDAGAGPTTSAVGPATRPAALPASSRPVATPGDWKQSDDKKLSLRFSPQFDEIGPDEAIVLIAELRNDSDQQMRVFRPFGNAYKVVESGLEITGPKGRVAYEGPFKEVEIGAASFAVLKPKQIIRDEISLDRHYFPGTLGSGQYRIVFNYVVGDEAPKGLLAFWQGRISSNQITIERGVK